GHVAARGGAEFRMGREAQSEFGERSAPEQADGITMGTSITALVRKASHPVEFVPPPGTPKYEGGTDCLYSHASWNHRAEFCFMWVTETGGNLDTIRDDHEIYEELLRQFYSVWDHIKNGPHADEARNWELVWVSPKAGKRESRRFVGDYILTQTDIEEARLFEDRVAYGGYALDIHDPVRTRARIIFHCIPPLFSIPYRCLYSRTIGNLMLAGRLMSVTHLALGAVRLMKTLATAGQAAGAAAHLCRKYDCLPRDLYPERVGELQQLLLRRDATILGLRNEDPDDLARSAKVTATSEAVFECAEAGDFLPLDCARGVVLWNWPEKLERIELYARNESDEAQRLESSVSAFAPERKWKAPEEHIPYSDPGPGNRMEWGNDNTIAKFAAVGSASAEIGPRSEGWAAFEFSPPLELPPRDETSDEGRCALVIAPADGVSLAANRWATDFAQRCEAREGDAAFTTMPEPLAIRIQPRPVHGEAMNVINGYNRRFCTNPVDMWMSAPGAPLPQSVVLEWPEPVRLGRVHLTFDTLNRSYLGMPFNCGGRVSEMCARDYSLEAEVDGEWRTLVEERGNYRRFRVHEFAPVTASRLRLTIRAANGDGWGARVYEIRAYETPG
ncbi:MAG: FAD-dependent oxidoreductase, partial [Armatimonadota bacterium]